MRKDNKKFGINKSNIFRGIALTVVLTVALVVAQPINTVNVFAAAVEDCDLDGYDDHTGNPVPWIGFDSTKGEEIPSGWDGHTIYKSKKAFEDSQKTDEEEKSDSSSSDSSSSSSLGSSVSGSSSSSSSSDSSPTSSSKSTSSSSSKTSNSSKSSKSKSSSSTSSSKSTNSKANKSSSVSSGSVDSSQTNNIEETTVTELTEETTAADDPNKKEKKKKKDKSEKNTEAAPEIIEPVDLQKVLNTKGNIAVNEADGSIIHAGSDLVITGTGFAGNVEDITIEIHSDNAINLASVNTAEDGSFESQVYIPKDLSEGAHEIVLLYQGQQIASQSIEVGPAVADTFLKAITVGFSNENKGLIPGLLILAGLFAVGIITVLIDGLFGKKVK